MYIKNRKINPSERMVCIFMIFVPWHIVSYFAHTIPFAVCFLKSRILFIQYVGDCMPCLKSNRGL